MTYFVGYHANNDPGLFRVMAQTKSQLAADYIARCYNRDYEAVKMSLRLCVVNKADLTCKYRFED